MDWQRLSNWLTWLLDQPWPFYFSAGLLAALGLWLAWKGLLSDRARGRRRCPKCWYDLRGTSGMRCSECGFAARREKQLFRSRRRWRICAIGFVFLLGAGATALGPQVRRDGWLSIVPTTILIAAADDDIFPPGIDCCWAELRRRNAAANFSTIDWAYLANFRMLHFRSRWPRGIPLAIEARLPMWTFFTRPQLWNAETGTVFPLDRNGSLVLESGGKNEVPDGLHAAIWWCKSIEEVLASHYECVWRGRLPLSIEFVDSIEDVIARASGPEIDAMVRNALHVELSVLRPTCGFGGREPSLRIELTFDRKQHERLHNVATAFGVDFLRDGRKIWQSDLERGFFASDLGGVVRHDYVENFSNQLDRWTLRIHGDPVRALRDWDCTEYWDGEFVVNAADVFRK